jgi:hypothetical protein
VGILLLYPATRRLRRPFGSAQHEIAMRTDYFLLRYT